MVGIKLNFTKRKGNTLKEVYQGRKKTLSGKLFSIRTHITFYKPGKFKDPFGLKHVVLYVDDGYQNIMVGTANRRFLWILSRQPEMETETYNILLAKAVALGYNIDKIRLTPQPMAVHTQPSF